MTRTCVLATTVALFVVSNATAQTGWRFRWQAGQVLTYRVEQATSAAETVEGKRTETTSKLNLTKRWQVLAVDGAGVATLQKTVTAMRLETRTPAGDTLVFDSAKPDQSHPQLREQLSKFVGQPLETLRVDTLGRVVEVKECKHGSPNRFESDLPFVIALPGDGMREGQTWERNYRITLDPPHGTGDKYDAVQKYHGKIVAGSTATVAFTTALRTQPESVADRVPLLQSQPEGEVVFDALAGLVRSARLRTEKELAGHQGEGSSYRFVSVYAEEYVAGP